MKALDKKLLRELWKIKGQVLAVSIVIACGVAVYIAFFSAFLNLNLTRDSYYKEYRFHDFSITLEKAPINSIFKIQNINGIKEASGRISKDVSINIKEQDELKSGRIISLPDKNNIIDNIYLMSGRKINHSELNECITDDKFFIANNLKLNEFISVTSNGKKQNLKIVGTVKSPEYVYSIRNASEIIPNPEKFGVIWVNKKWAEGTFNLNGFYNELIAEINESENIDTIIDSTEKQLEPYGIYSKIKRKDQLSNWMLTSELEQLAVTSKVTPSIFLFVASIILIIVISRMVKKEKTYIGLLKAYGYSNLEVSLHYIKYSFIIGIIGGLLGGVLGQYLSYGLMGLYSKFYSFPELIYKFYPSLFFIGIIISISSCLFSSLFAISSVIEITPVDAMKENTSIVVVKTPFEKIEFIWEHISFIDKIIIRNIWRYPLRSAFTALGVMLSTAILFLGYFQSDAVKFLMEHQFNKVQKEDLKISFYTERDKRAYYESLRFPYVRKVEEMLIYPFEVKNKWYKKQMVIYGLKENSKLYNLINNDGQYINVPEYGIYLSEMVAKQLHVKKGDKITLIPLMGNQAKKEKYVTISGIVQQYLGVGMYMNIDTLSRLLGNSKIINTLLLKLEDQKDLSKLNKYLKKIPIISSVEVKKDSVENFNKNTADSMKSSNFILSLFAGVIAISVIYNSTVINITEREKEIASLQVLGFNESEVGKIVFSENIILSFIGMFLGLPLGYYMCKSMTTAYDTEYFRIPFIINNSTYILCASFISFFVIITNLFKKENLSN
ncbi:MAG: FtsX-like permease family protein [Candidatus Sericytochromatia bacterium]